MISKKNPFYNAFQGLKWFGLSQWNFKIHLAATIIVLVMTFWLKLNPYEWLFISLAIGIVWITELLNTAIEFVLDKLHPEEDPMVGKAKDIAAAAVLLASILAVVIGIIIFLPKLLPFF